MAYGVEVIVEVGWIPEGTGGAMMAQFQANEPGQGQGTAMTGFGVNPPGTGQVPQPRTAFMAQKRRYIVFEGVTGVSAATTTLITLANILTAISQAAFDIAGATGTPIITTAELTTIQNWSTGSP